MVKILKVLFFLVLLTVTAGCSGREDLEDAVPDKDYQDMIYVTPQQVTIADGIEIDPTDETSPILLPGFKSGDRLYFSQMPQGGEPNFSDYSSQIANYLYIYEYNGNENATWGDGYNFKPYTGRLGFTWDNIIAVGPSGNAFKFFGFYFPVGQTPVWEVQQDQTGGETNQYDESNFLKSDILGAYHSTSAIFTRMRFRLFHLMTYLKVTVYVPVFNGNSADPSNQSYSGFDEGAMQGAYVLDAITNFSIEWAASKSSDSEAPLVQTDPNSPKSNIKMYRHNTDESEIMEIPITPYYSGNVEDLKEKDKDVVRRYDFSVLFPTQTFGDNFLCFALKTPGGSMKYYYFSESQKKTGPGEGFDLTQGTLQQLFLYLPRKTNQTVLVGANIIPWKDAVTDMTVNKQTNGN